MVFPPVHYMRKRPQHIKRLSAYNFLFPSVHTSSLILGAIVVVFLVLLSDNSIIQAEMESVQFGNLNRCGAVQ